MVNSPHQFVFFGVLRVGPVTLSTFPAFPQAPVVVDLLKAVVESLSAAELPVLHACAEVAFPFARHASSRALLGALKALHDGIQLLRLFLVLLAAAINQTNIANSSAIQKN